MKVLFSDSIGFMGSSAEFGRVVQALKDMIPPVVSRTGTEYALRLANGSACIFRVNIDEKPRLIEGSMLVEIEMGSLKVGFVDINDENIEDNIRSVIREFWRIINEDSNAECAVVYSPIASRDVAIC